VVFYPRSNGGPNFPSDGGTFFITLLLKLPLLIGVFLRRNLLRLCGAWGCACRRGVYVARSVIGARSRASVAVVKEDIAVAYCAGSHPRLIAQKNIPIPDCAKRDFPFAGIEKNLSVPDCAKCIVAVAVVKVHVSVTNRAICLVAIAVVNVHAGVLSK